MKTTLHLHRPPPSPPAVARRPRRQHTVRLGIGLSLVATLLAVVVEAVFDVPVVVILVPVVVVGFALSWSASGRLEHRDERST